MPSSLPAGFGHYELFDNATFGEQQIADQLRLFNAFETHIPASERDLFKQLLRQVGEDEAKRKAQRKAIQAGQQRCAEAEERVAALDRSARRSRETVAWTHTRAQHCPSFDACTR